MLKKVKDIFNSNNKIIRNILVFNILFLLFGMMYISKNMYYTDKSLYFKYFSYGEIGLCIINYIYIIYLIIRKKYNYSIIAIILFILMILEITMVFYSKDINTSIWGSFNRHEGLLQIFYYYSLFFLGNQLNDDSYKKQILHFILLVGVICSLYGIYQAFIDNEYLYKSIGSQVYYPAGITIHSNFFGTIMVISICISLSMAIIDNKKLLYYMLSFIYIIGMYVCNSTNCILTIIILVTCLFIYLCINKRKELFKLILFIILSIVIGLCLQKLDKTNLFNDLNKFVYQSKSIAEGNIEDNFGTGRIYIWKSILNILPKYIVHGTGIDCLLQMGITNSSYVRIDKAHNEFLNILITEGIFVFIAYIIFLITIVINYIKKYNKNNYIVNICFIVFIAYLFQSMFNIRVIEVAPYFYIVMAFIYQGGRKCKLKN